MTQIDTKPHYARKPNCKRHELQLIKTIIRHLRPEKTDQMIKLLRYVATRRGKNEEIRWQQYDGATTSRGSKQQQQEQQQQLHTTTT